MSKKRLKVQGLLANIKAWAVAGGAESEVPTNPYELIRLRVKGGVAIVYRKECGTQTWNPLAMQLREAFHSSQPFPEALRPVAKVRNNGTTSVTHRTLIDRDGAGCFFCFEQREQMTIEHLVPRAHGGPNHLSNKFRACQPCNSNAGHLSAPEKIRIRETALIARIEAAMRLL